MANQTLPLPVHNKIAAVKESFCFYSSVSGREESQSVDTVHNVNGTCVAVSYTSSTRPSIEDVVR